MRILYLHQHFTTPQGAGGTRSYQLARALINAGHNVTMVCGSYAAGTTGLDGSFKNGRRTGRVDGIDVVEIDLAYSNSLSFTQRIRKIVGFAAAACKIVLTQPYDLLFATSTPLTVGIPATIGRGLRGKRMIFEVRDLWPELPREMGVIRNPIILAAMSALEWLSYRSADAVVALAPGITDGIARRGVSRNMISLLPNNSNLEMFDIEPQTSLGAKVVLGIDEGTFVAAYTGTFGVANGLGAILDAASILKARNKQNIRLVLVGEGASKAALARRIVQENLTNVTILPSMPKLRLVHFLKGVDLCLMTLQNIPAFYFGTSPNKFFDYIAAGRPVLTNYPGWVAEMIQCEQCGYAVAPNDPIAFADALERAATASDLQQMAARSLALAKRDFNTDTISAKFVQIVERTARPGVKETEHAGPNFAQQEPGAAKKLLRGRS